ncbi:MAG TPA: hypothetical protein PLE82_06375 [Saccharofermentans sp.]|nr:hypothetical protein [Saccharofermentans sp.]
MKIYINTNKRISANQVRRLTDEIVEGEIIYLVTAKNPVLVVTSENTMVASTYIQYDEFITRVSIDDIKKATNL